MRGILLGTLAGLVLGTLGTLGYTHYVGAGKQLEQVQAQLATTADSLAKTSDETQQLKSETASQTAQIQQLTATNADLKRQITDLKNSPPSPATPPPNPMANMMKAGLALRNQQRLLLLESRLHLTPEQITAVQAAMDEENKRMEEMTARMFQGGKIDPNAFKNMQGANSVDKTLSDLLSPDQKTAYDQMKTDEKNSQLETAATNEMNQLAPLLQLSDSQKDQVYSALYQQHVDSQDPTWIKNNMAGSTNPATILENQAKAKEDALAKVLTPQQLAIYHQQAQSQLDMQKAMVQKFEAPATATPATTGQ